MGGDARGALRHRVSGDDSAAWDRFWAAARHVVVGPAVAHDAARDRHHVQRDGHAIYQPYRTHRPLRLLLYPGRDAAISALWRLLPRRPLPRAGPAGSLVHPALPRGQRVQGARHGAFRGGTRRPSLDPRVYRSVGPDPGPDHAQAAHRVRVGTLVV